MSDLAKPATPAEVGVPGEPTEEYMKKLQAAGGKVIKVKEKKTEEK